MKSQDKSPVADKAFAQLSGLPGVKVGRAVLTVPQAGFGLELVEYSGVKRSPVVLRLQDAGIKTRFKDRSMRYFRRKCSESRRLCNSR